MWKLDGKRVAAKDVPPSVKAAFGGLAGGPHSNKPNYHGFIVYAHPGERTFRKTNMQSAETSLLFFKVVKAFETLASVDVPTLVYRIREPTSGDEAILELPATPDPTSGQMRVFTIWYYLEGGGRPAIARALLQHLSNDFGAFAGTSVRTSAKKSPAKSPKKSPPKSPSKKSKSPPQTIVELSPSELLEMERDKLKSCQQAFSNLQNKMDVGMDVISAFKRYNLSRSETDILRLEKHVLALEKVLLA